MLGPGLKLVSQLADGLVLVDVTAFQLVDFLLQHQDQTLLRFYRLTVTVDAHDLLFLAGGVVAGVLVPVGVGVALLAFPLALRALVGALLVPANLINHQLITSTRHYNRMNIPPLIPLKQADVAKYLPQAIELTLTGRIAESEALTRAEKVSISKIFKNLNTICKLSIKEVKEVIKNEPAYQEALADLYFDKRINNYMLITSYEKPLEGRQKVLVQTDPVAHPHLVCGVEYRIEFTISNIAKKNVMRPVILLVFRLKNGTSVQIYYNLQQFSLLRAKVAGSMKQVYGIELRAL